METLRVLRPLALWMHETSPGVGLVNETGLQRELERIFTERKERNPERAARQFLEDVRAYTSLLLDRGGRQYGFIHLTLQEYLAASALGQAHQQEVEPIVSVLAAHVGEAPWREVSLLTLGYLGLVQERDQAAGAVLDALVRRSPGPAGEAPILAGEALLDMGPGAVAKECRERIVESLLVTLREDGKVTSPRRARAGAVLARIGDPRPEVTTVDGMEFCWMPAGPFLQGSEESDEEAFDEKRPWREHVLSYGLWVGRYPVTAAQYGEYEAETGEQRGYRQGASEPVAGVSWYDAVAFCRWLTSRWSESGRLGREWEARLPLEEEWEKAARGGLRIPSRPVIQRAGGATPKIREKVNPLPGRRFPWGQKENSDRANYGDEIGGRSAVGCYPGGASPYGVEELSGNVFEWNGKGQETPEESARLFRALRGGAFNFNSSDARCAFRHWNTPDDRNTLIGFRVVLSPFPL